LGGKPEAIFKSEVVKKGERFCEIGGKSRGGGQTLPHEDEGSRAAKKSGSFFAAMGVKVKIMQMFSVEKTEEKKSNSELLGGGSG